MKPRTEDATRLQWCLIGLPYVVSTACCSAFAAWLLHHQWITHLSATHSASPTLQVLRATAPSLAFIYIPFAAAFFSYSVLLEPVFTWYPLRAVRRCFFWSSLFVAAASPFATLLNALSS